MRPPNFLRCRQVNVFRYPVPRHANDSPWLERGRVHRLRCTRWVGHDPDRPMMFRSHRFDWQDPGQEPMSRSQRRLVAWAFLLSVALYACVVFVVTR